jgi:capsular exopolysaccharide synthesis family protein
MNDDIKRLNNVAENKIISLSKDTVLPSYVARQIDNTGIDARIMSYHDPKSSVCENYRAIFTHLKNSLAKHDSNLIAITSSQRHEGNTVTLLNLAIVVARDFNKKVLVVDCNMRNATVDELMNLKSNGGLSNILTADIDYRNLVHKTPISNLGIITAGKEIHNSVELLHSPRLKYFLTKVKADFDYVFCDTAAFIPYADTKILSPLVDGVILAIKARKTRKEVVDRTEEILKELNSRIFGFILTDIEYHIPEFIYKYL